MYTFAPIATISSPYKEKFAIPRQPGLVTAAKGQIIFNEDHNQIELIRDIEQFSHLWLIFVFHGTAEQGWKPLVRPPRLGGNKKTGVLATRSTFRPNPLGMSVVKQERIELLKLKGGKKQLTIHISALDLLDGTPILDIKPYVPYSDAVTNADGGFAQSAPSVNLCVKFTQQAVEQIKLHEQQYPQLTLLIEQVLQQDPRPAYKQNQIDNKVYGMRLHHFNICWQVIEKNIVIVNNILSL